MPKAKKSENVPKTMRDTFERIVSLTDSVAHQYLNDEYAQLMRYATAALCRKRPSPLSSGTPKTWACGITHAIGMVNFLFDPSQEPHMKAPDLYKAFGVSAGSGLAKSKIVRDTLDMMQLDPDWCLPSKMDDNPLAWMVMVDGLIVDARQLPREIQEVAYERGIIPYLPDAPAPETPRAKTRKAARGSSSQAQCGLCGRRDALTKTPCCGQWICDDAHTYQLFSYARNSCFRNHDRYTLCAAHYHEGHAGPWQACEACKNAFDTEMYVYYGTNEYNFAVLENPPAYAPTHCDDCGATIVLSEGGYSMGAEGYRCAACTAKEFGNVC
jgi:hypothetical protein